MPNCVTCGKKLVSLRTNERTGPGPWKHEAGFQNHTAEARTSAQIRESYNADSRQRRATGKESK
jgi:hypothetical protein